MVGIAGDVIAGTPSASLDARARMMVLRAFLAQNVAVGSAFGGFGVSVLSLQELHGASRGQVALALSLSVLMMGLISPVVGTLITRLGLRWTMSFGTLISGCGYALLAVAPNIQIVLLLYAVPIGVGLSMFGSFPSSVLASNWYSHKPGLALGIANMPLFVAVLPVVGSIIIRDHGLPAFYLALAAIHGALLPLMLGISDRAANGVEHAAGMPGPRGTPPITIGSILRSPYFWAMSLSGGYLDAVAMVGVSHLAAFAAERGVTAEAAAGLLSIMGGAAILGSIATGVLSNRVGAAVTLALVAAGLAISWLALLSTSSLGVMGLAYLTLGAGSAGVFPAISMVSSRLFGQQALSRVIGAYTPAAMPVTFVLPPLAGVLRDAAGSYTPVAFVVITGCAVAAAVFLLIERGRANRAGDSRVD